MEKRNLNYISVYTFCYVALGVLTPLVGQYLDSIGFTGTQIGSIVAGGTTVAILTATFWGTQYKKSKNKKQFLWRLCVAAAFFGVVEYFVHSYAVFLLVYCTIYFFQSPTLALIDAMAIEDEQPFGAARKWGAIGFALAVFFAGRLSFRFGLSVIFFLYAASFLVCGAIIYGMSRKPQSANPSPLPQPDVQSEKRLFHNKKYVKIIVCAFFICGTTVAHNVYFGFLYTSTGGTVAGIGLAFFLMAGSEAPFMAWSKWFADRISLEKMILFSMCVSVIRFAWYSTGPSSGLLLAFFFLQGMVNGIILVEFVRYIAKVVSQDNLGMAISVYYGLGSNLSTILCQLLGGIILDHFGPGGVYGFFAAMNGVGVILYIGFGLYKKQE